MVTCADTLEPVPTKGELRTANRRRFPRYRTNLPLRVRTQEGRHLSANCFVISEGGLGASLPERIPVGSIVLLQFSLSTDSTLLLSALVRNEVNLSYGFEFVSLSQAERLSVEAFCNTLALKLTTFVCAHV
jgi:c-di-GMP-binding flagellar brake protein YcgR